MNFDKKQIRTVIFIAFACIAFYLGLNNIGIVASSISYVLGIISPFILGAAIAFILNVPMSKIENRLFVNGSRLKSGKRGISFLITLVLVAGVLIIALYIIIPQLGETLLSIAKQLPDAFAGLQDWFNNNSHIFKNVKQIIDYASIDISSIIKSITEWARDTAMSMADTGIGAVSNIIGAVINFFIGFIFSIYILLSKEKLGSQCKQALYACLGEKKADNVLYVLRLASTTFSKFISGQCLDACILGLMFFVAMLVLGMPYAMLISVLIAFCALIPILGAFIGCILGALLILMVNPLQALIFIIVFIVLQQIDGNLIYPHVVGGSVGLPSIWVLVAVTVGGSLMGVIGMIIFIPISSVLYSLFRTYVKGKLAKGTIPKEKWISK